MDAFTTVTLFASAAPATNVPVSAAAQTDESPCYIPVDEENKSGNSSGCVIA